MNSYILLVATYITDIINTLINILVVILIPYMLYWLYRVHKDIIWEARKRKL